MERPEAITRVHQPGPRSRDQGRRRSARHPKQTQHALPVYDVQIENRSSHYLWKDKDVAQGKMIGPRKQIFIGWEKPVLSGIGSETCLGHFILTGLFPLNLRVCLRRDILSVSSFNELHKRPHRRTSKHMTDRVHSTAYSSTRKQGCRTCHA